MNNTTRTKEQQRLEECMCHNMEHGGSICTHAQRQEHKAKLADRRVGEYLLDIVLPDSYCGSNYSRSQTNNGNNMQCIRSKAVEHIAAGYHVNTCSNHGSSMNECG